MTKMKKLVLLFMINLFLCASFIQFANALIGCSITQICPDDNTIFKASSNYNAHAGAWDSNYNFKVCCPPIVGRTCSGGNNFIRIQNTNSVPIVNAHLEKNTMLTPGYFDLCFGPDQIQSCSYKPSCDASTELCLASIDKDTNAHASDCNTFSSNICCKCNPTETSCTDGLDNDCDGQIDCKDTDCAGSIGGTVEDTDGNKIDNAGIGVLEDLKLRYSGISGSGIYKINNILCGTYNLVAKADDYIPSVKENVYLPPRTAITVEFTFNSALVKGTSCQADCTYARDIIVHKECSGHNGCAFLNTNAQNACNFAQLGWIRPYDSSSDIECSGSPLGIPIPKIFIPARISCREGHLVKTTRIASYRGEPVKLVVAVCS